MRGNKATCVQRCALSAHALCPRCSRKTVGVGVIKVLRGAWVGR